MDRAIETSVRSVKPTVCSFFQDFSYNKPNFPTLGSGKDYRVFQSLSVDESIILSS